MPKARAVSTPRASCEEPTPGGAAEVPTHIRGIHRGAEPRREYQACLVPLLTSGTAFGILLSAPSDERRYAQISAHSTGLNVAAATQRNPTATVGAGITSASQQAPERW